MLAFAANSILCRLALRNGHIDAATFTLVRVASGALMLWLLSRNITRKRTSSSDWIAAAALASYAAAFSFSYISLTAGTGALLLFTAVQATMIARGIFEGEHLRRMHVVGLSLAIGGLILLVLPGISRPPLRGALLMIAAGVAWGVYSLRGRSTSDPVGVTAGNFLRAVPLAAVLVFLLARHIHADISGVAWAIASGAIASGIGYAIWYAALRGLTANRAAAVQLSVPVIAALAGVIFLGEAVTIRQLIASSAVLGGIAIVVSHRG